MTRSRKPAVLRGLASATLAIFTALAGHVVAGGTMPGPLGIAVPWLLALMACVLLSGKKLSFIRLCLGVGLGQVFFHTLFVLGSITPTASLGGHVHGASLVLSADDPLSGAIVSTAGMWASHGVVALLTAALLHRGERLLLGLRDLAVAAARWVRRRAHAASPAPLGLSPQLRFSAGADDERLPPAPLLTAVRRRGPPQRLAF